MSLDSIDDEYEPERSVAQVRRLPEHDDRVALLRPVGTPTAQAKQPLASAGGVPVIGPFTGAGVLGAADMRNVFKVCASYGAETERWIKNLVDDMELTKWRRDMPVSSFRRWFPSRMTRQSQW